MASAPDADELAALARRIVRGDEAAFVRFHDTFYAPLLRLARALSRRDDAFCCDVVQDVLLAVAQRLPALRDAAAVRAWLSRAVANAVVDHVRAERRRQQREQRAAEVRDHEAHEPWQELSRHEQQQFLLANLAALPPAEQALLAARFGEAGVAAIAVDLGISEDAAFGRLRRALERRRWQEP